MNSRQRRKKRRAHTNATILSKRYEKYKTDPRCIKARTDMRKRISDFSHCGSGNGGYIALICDNCPAIEDNYWFD